jgi:hypothetical protein
MYSPKIKEEFIPVLYQLSRRAGLPMTAYVNRIIGEALAGEAGEDEDRTLPGGGKTLRPLVKGRRESGRRKTA